MLEAAEADARASPHRYSHVHLHVISSDMISPKLKNKKCVCSFLLTHPFSVLDGGRALTLSRSVVQALELVPSDPRLLPAPRRRDKGRRERGWVPARASTRSLTSSLTAFRARTLTSQPSLARPFRTFFPPSPPPALLRTSFPSRLAGRASSVRAAPQGPAHLALPALRRVQEPAAAQDASRGRVGAAG